MKLSTLSAAATAILCLGVMGVAMADEPMNCARLTGIERAQCQVQQHMQLLKQLGRLPASYTYSSANYASSSMSSMSSSAMSSSSSDASSMSSASSTSSFVSTTGQILSCSRIYGIQRAQCLVQQRKQMLEQLKNKPKSSSSAPTQSGSFHPTCVRYRDQGQRMQCLTGKPITAISSSSMMSSSMSSMSSSMSSLSSMSSSSMSSSMSSTSSH